MIKTLRTFGCEAFFCGMQFIQYVEKAALRLFHHILDELL